MHCKCIASTSIIKKKAKNLKNHTFCKQNSKYSKIKNCEKKIAKKDHLRRNLPKFANEN